MRLARPRTLWWFITAELWKLLLLTTAVVLAVAVFGFTVRPLAEGRLGPVEALRFMLYAIVPMLQYALPFAAGFSATLVYHRLAADNESTAAFAAGISHRKLLVPAAATGLVLGLVMLVIADQAMPRLLRAAQEMITQDVAKLVVGQIKRGDSIKLGPDRMIYADDVTALGPDPAGGAFERLVLSGVLAIELSDRGEVTREAASRLAYVWLYRGRAPAGAGAGGGAGGVGGEAIKMADGASEGGADDPGGTTVVLRLRDALGQGRGVGLSALEDSTMVYRVPNAMQDDPKYFSWAQLRRVSQRPELMDWIDLRRRMLAAALSEDVVAERVGGVLARDGRLTLLDGAGRRVVLRAGGLQPTKDAGGWLLRPIASSRAGVGSGVEVTTEQSDGSVRTQRALRGFLLRPGRDEVASGLIGLRLEEVEAWTGSTPAADSAAAGGVGGAGGAGRLSQWTLDGLRLDDGPGEGVMEMTTGELLNRVGPIPAITTPRLKFLAEGLDSEVRFLRLEILSKLQERLAVSVSAALMVLCGAVLGLSNRQSLPLTVYLWSFIPALACLLTIAGGQKTTHSYGLVGLPLLWGGVVAMSLFTFLEYRKLARH
jgi:lipopolysaccharide export LptBFGC system permease protein LptF